MTIKKSWNSLKSVMSGYKIIYLTSAKPTEMSVDKDKYLVTTSTSFRLTCFQEVFELKLF